MLAAGTVPSVGGAAPGGVPATVDGAMVGKSPDALPPGLSDVPGIPAAPLYGGSAGPAPVTPTGVAAATTATDPDACGVVRSPVAVTLAVSVTADTRAVCGIVTWA